MSKKKPNYTKFMKRPAPLQMSPPSDVDQNRPIHRPLREEDIPWAEIIEVHDPGIIVTPVPEEATFNLPESTSPPSKRTLASRAWNVAWSLGQHSISAVRLAGSAPGSEAPPLPVMVLTLMLLLLMI
jgi:hypothetical protein